MDFVEQHFTVSYQYKTFFTVNVFDPSNKTLKTALGESIQEKKLLFVVDNGVAQAHPQIVAGIHDYASANQLNGLVPDIIVVPGGEQVKNSMESVDRILQAVNRYGVDRHSFIVAIGGGAVLDMAGYASTIAHRGIRHLRLPTTVLSQNDSGIGVKNSLNYFDKKNFLGTFSPPFAVINDARFLETLDDRNWRAGIAEAIKVALIKDRDFFYWIERVASSLNAREPEVMNELIRRCAVLHLKHIAGGDPFEMGSSRPLDFGHWSAHKLEQLTNFEVLHGEAVAMGIALDTMYSALDGRIDRSDADRVINLLIKLGFAITHPSMAIENADSPLVAGLQEFREHLGGRLTIMLLDAIGRGVEVHAIDATILQNAYRTLEQKTALA
jgi:3-dehydroquinate synthase